jgi:lysozyme family protein
MPAAIALCVFDTAVGCGVGMGVKLLQRALGVPADGHYGLITQAALQNADIPQTAIKLIAARETYHRACPTFPAFGKGWLARDAATRHEALALCPAVDTPPAAAAVPDTDIPDYSDVAQDSRRAPVPVPPDTVTETKTGRSAAVKAGILGGFGLHQLLELYDGAQRNGLLAPEHLMPVAAIIACVTGLAFCRRDIIDRAFKLIQGV